MARAWRIEYEGALYQALSRGNERRDVFADDDDRRMFLNTLGEMAERFEAEVFAYVLMDNHYHLVFRTQRANLSRAMQWLGVTYTNRFNARHSRSGHLFQGRFKNMLAQNDAYLLRLSYYIHRNPLRAGIVQRLADYPWSSYRVYAYGKPAQEWLNSERLLSQFTNAGDRNAAYRKNTQKYAGEEDRLWEDLHHGFLLGTAQFVDAIKEAFLPETPHREMPQQRRISADVDLESALEKAAAFLGCDRTEFKKGRRVSSKQVLNRDLLPYLAWQTGLRTNSEIGEIFGIGGSAVSRRVEVMQSKAASEWSLQKTNRKIRAMIES